MILQDLFRLARLGKLSKEAPVSNGSGPSTLPTHVRTLHVTPHHQPPARPPFRYLLTSHTNFDCTHIHHNGSTSCFSTHVLRYFCTDVPVLPTSGKKLRVRRAHHERASIHARSAHTSRCTQAGRAQHDSIGTQRPCKWMDDLSLTRYTTSRFSTRNVHKVFER